MAADVYAARDNPVRQVLRLLSAEHEDGSNPHFGDELEHSQELVALAARDLTEATNALPENKRPIGWGGEHPIRLGGDH